MFRLENGERGRGLMSPLAVQRDGWLICLQEVQMERGSLMVPNGEEEKLAAESKLLLLLSQVKVLGHWERMGRTASRSVTIVLRTCIL